MMAPKQSTSDIAVIAAGAVTSVGLSAASTCAAIRASLDNFSETHFVDELGEPVLGAMVPHGVLDLLEERDGFILGGGDKLAAMLLRAAAECVSAVTAVDGAKTALLLIGPEASRPSFDEDVTRQCFDACQRALGGTSHPASRITAAGRCGLGLELLYARKLLTHPSSPVRRVLIAAVDSLLNVADINEALASQRLLTSEHSDGFIPGEAAGCVMLSRLEFVTLDAREPHRGASPVLRILGESVGEEVDTWHSGRANTGRGLAQAIRGALQAADMKAGQIAQRLCDVSGESFFFDESTFAWGRVLRAPFPTEYSFHTLASSIGEVGAACGPLMLALNLDMARKSWAAGTNTLIHLSSCEAARCAVVTSTV